MLAPVVQAFNYPWLAPVLTAALRVLPVIYAFVAVPLLDYVLGEEEELGEPLDSGAWYKPLYRGVCHGFVLLHIGLLLCAAHVVTTVGSLPLFPIMCLNMSICGGFAFAVAHELVHSRHRFDRFCSEVLLTLVCYKQWGLSHMAHHAQVATQEDPASARYREPVRTSQEVRKGANALAGRCSHLIKL